MSANQIKGDERDTEDVEGHRGSWMNGADREYVHFGIVADVKQVLSRLNQEWPRRESDNTAWTRLISDRVLRQSLEAVEPARAATSPAPALAVAPA